MCPAIWQVRATPSTLLRDDEENPDGTVNQLAGTFNTTLFKVEPRWKARLGVAYAQDAWGINVDERYLGGREERRPGPLPQRQPRWLRLHRQRGRPGLFYTDVSATYTYKNINVTVGVQNLFDKDPRVIFGDICACNTPVRRQLRLPGPLRLHEGRGEVLRTVVGGRLPIARSTPACWGTCPVSGRT
ncbi:MAG: TonB-dependent receptor [Aliidongia sp.]